ncbi:MAG: hypothetical protein SV760_00610 [Halobacteria archaeon]|nr:hypothetical protein [Halobacteria archaeon]
MKSKTPYIIVVVGALMIVGSAVGSVSKQIQMMGLVMGFTVTVAGLAISVKDSFKMEARTEQETSDPSPVIRLFGAFVGLGSLLTPYIKIPITAGDTGTAYTFIEMLQAIQSGQSIQGSLVLLIFMGVVIAGSFLGIFHHLGGYIMLFGTMAFTFVVMRTVGSGLVDVLRNEFKIGLYVAVGASLIIIASSFVKPDADIDSDSDWSVR